MISLAQTEQDEWHQHFIRFIEFMQQQHRKKLNAMLQEEEEAQYRSYTYPTHMQQLDRSLC